MEEGENETRDIYKSGAEGIRQLECVVIGGGNRGKIYSSYAIDHPHLLKVKAIADPKKTVRTFYQKTYNVPEKMQFTDWKEIAERDKFADLAIICTQDAMHKDPAIALSDKGYHLLIEKPLATTEDDCEKIIEACEKNNTIFTVGHVLRYYPPNRKIEDLIQTGVIGDVHHINHFEPVGHFHFAHSYVRGNWRKESESSFSLMTKSCHDIDLIANWMKHQKTTNQSGINSCAKVSSFGSLSHFTKANKPSGAADRCLDCKVESQCPYSAKRIYVDRAKVGMWGWPVSIVTDTPDIESLYNELRNGPYGECVYNGHNDVCDHQTVNMEFSGGQTATFSMVAYTKRICDRTTHIFGDRGEIVCDGGDMVTHYDFLTGKTTFHQCPAKLNTRLTGHNGADFFLMDSFIRAVMFNQSSLIQSGARDTLRSHQIVFNAERSRVKGQVVTIKSD